MKNRQNQKFHNFLEMFSGRERVRFRKSQVIAALLNVVALTAMLEVGNESLVVIVLSNFMVKFLFGFSIMAQTYIVAGIDYFRAENFALASGISCGIGIAGGMPWSPLHRFLMLSSLR